MPELFEQHFAQRKEERKSPEQIKEKKALELAKEIKEIKERMKKEGKTIEGYRRIIELTKRIKEIYEEFISEKAKKLYQSLKETPLWDEEKKQWNWYMDKEGNLKRSYRLPDNQLLGVLAEAVTGNLEEAKELYQSLKETPLWDEEKKQWNYYMDEKGEVENFDRYSMVQLLGVLTEAVTGNLKEAKELYQSLKQTSLWDKEKKQWNSHMDREGNLRSSYRFSEAQLLGVLAEAVAGSLEEAKEIYQSLKQTLLWDKEKKQWNWCIDEKGEAVSPYRRSRDQLLGVLAEAVAGNLKEAKKLYQSLKQTPLWDKEKKQWNWGMDEGGKLEDSDRLSEAQLLGVLAEALDEKGEEFVEFLRRGNK